MNILVVDDHEQNRYQLQVLLAGEGYAVVTAANGAEALEKARQNPPDLIITDILMPVMDGFSLCREWKRDERLRHIPLVFYTATYTDEKDQELALNLGAARFIVKPEEPETFLQTIKAVIANQEHGILAAPRKAIQDEAVYLKEYSQALIRKLEVKMEMLGQANRELARDLAERKRAEEALAALSTRYEATLAAVPDIIVEVDNRKVYTWANQAGITFFGDDVVGKEAALYFEGEQTTYQLVEPLFGGRENVIYVESWQRRKDGERRLLAWWCRVLKDAAGNVTGALSAARDITDQRRAEEALRESEQRLESIVETTPAGIVILDRHGRVTYANAAAEQILGLTRSDIRTRVYNDPEWKITAADGTPFPDEQLPFVRVTRSNHPVHGVEHAIARRDGSRAILSVNAAPLRDAAGLPVGVVAAIIDITERKRAEEALRASERRYQTLAEISPVGIFRTDAQGQTTYVNPRWCQISGLSAAEALGDGWLRAVHPEDRTKLAQGWQVAAEAQRTSMAEYRFVHADGTLAWVMGQAVPEKDQADRIVGYVGTITDVTERKQAEERIREQAALLDQANDAIYVARLDGTVLYWNRAAEQIYGWSAAEVVGRKTTELLSVGDPKVANVLGAVVQKGDWSGERQRTTKAGHVVDILSRITLLRDNEGRPRAILVIDTDITARKELEARFLRAQRLESIGALAGGIAHDLNNVLAPIIMGVPLLRDAVKAEPDRKLLALIETSAQRGADIVRQVLTFVRGTEGQRVSLQPKHFVRDMIKMIHEMFPKNIRVEDESTAKVWPVEVDATQLHQSLMNLCVNARDAMPGGGTLTLAVENVTIDKATAAQTPGVSAGPFVRLRVRDTGTGMSPEVRARVFEPFFTTKALGKGTGLGLSTVRGIARSHGGFVRFDSEVGRGTSFELYLPALPSTPSRAPAGSEPPWPHGAGERVLLVDDEAAVREVARQALKEFGYRVIMCAAGAEAVKVFQDSHRDIHLVVTDMMMPEMDGPTLVGALRAIDPGVRILGITGASEAAGVSPLQTAAISALLAKPFTIGQLLDAVHKALQPAAPRK